MPTHIIVACGDQHCGSTVGLMHPNGVYHDDGLHISPSKYQRWLWEKHEEFLDKVEQIRASEPDSVLHYWNTGDLVDGDHHNTTQIVGRAQGMHVSVARDVLEKGVLALEPDYVHIMRGTPSHVGAESGLEKGVAQLIEDAGHKLVRDHDTGSLTWRILRAEIGGVTFDVRHHGRAGQREHTRRSYQSIYAFDIWASYTTTGAEAPDIAVRSHKHKFMDSGYDHRGVTRAVATPAWQLATEYVHKLAIESLADIGGVVFVCRNGECSVKPILFTPERPKIWRPS